MKLSKVYAVEVNYPEKIETGIGIFSRNYAIRDRRDVTAVFSTRKFAQKYIDARDYPYDDEARGTRIIEWKVEDKDIIQENDETKIYGHAVDRWKR